jgi:hypothetical protein
MPALWWLIGQTANLLQCITFAYYCGLFLVGLPIFLPQIVMFLAAACAGWAAWSADVQQLLTHLFCATRSCWAAWAPSIQSVPMRVLPDFDGPWFAEFRRMIGGENPNDLRGISEASVGGIRYVVKNILDVGRR